MLHTNSAPTTSRTPIRYLFASAVLVASLYAVLCWQLDRDPIGWMNLTRLPQCPRPHVPNVLIHIPPADTVNVLITGAAGYIGSHMAMILLLEKSTRYNVVCVDDLSRGDKRHINTLTAMAAQLDRTFVFVQSDIADVEKMTNTMRTYTIDLVIHFAGFAYASESILHPLTYFENIVTRTQQLLAAMDAVKVRRLVYSSSSATYGTITDAHCDSPLKEYSPQRPLSPYGTSKLMAEQVILAYAHSKHIAGEAFSAVLLRYFNVIGSDPQLRVGPMPKSHLANYGRIVDSCFDAAVSGQPMNLYGEDFPTPDGSPIRDYIDVMDLVDAHLQLTHIVHSNQVEPFNIGYGIGYSVKEVVAACESATGTKVRTTIQPRRLGDPAVVMGDTTKLMKELQWKPKYGDITQSIKTAWKWRLIVEKEGHK